MMDGFGWHGGYMGLGWIFWILIIGLFIWIAARMIRPAGGKNETDSRSAVAILDERYARGEIGRDEFMERKRDLENS
jgi:putative membrane protein